MTRRRIIAMPDAFSKKYPFLHIPEEPGLYPDRAENPGSADRQSAYEEERRIKEAALLRFFSPSFTGHEELEPLLLLHSRLSARLLQELTAGRQVDILTLEHHIFACALLTAKTGKMREALGLLRAFFSLCNESKDCAHLYRMLLLTSPGEAPGARADVPAVQDPPLVAVVTPLFNQGQYLEEAVRSVLHQTEPRWEMIIINDGSTDRSLRTAKELLASVNDPRIRLISQANSGKGKTRNRGMRETSAPFICVLDADDMICPTYFSDALKILEKEPEVGWVCPQTLVFGGNNHLTWTWEYDFFASLLQSPAPSSALYRRAVWEEAGGYDEDMIDAEDYVFWIKAGEKGLRGKTSEEVLFVYRHAFKRFGCRQDINIKRKQQYIAKHPWWYKSLPPKAMLPYLARFPVMIFPEELLNIDAVNATRPAYGDRAAFRAAVDALKEHALKNTEQ